jgi:quercetin dioxygenase-like cupin family protein
MSQLENTLLALQIHLPSGPKSAQDIPWNTHPKFQGVALQHLITGTDTNGQFSCHLVCVDPGCTLGTHIHTNQWELHEVLQGNGLCMIGAERIDYAPGCMAAIPQGSEHSVQAGKDGLILLAKFCPSLL